GGRERHVDRGRAVGLAVRAGGGREVQGRRGVVVHDGDGARPGRAEEVAGGGDHRGDDRLGVLVQGVLDGRDQDGRRRDAGGQVDAARQRGVVVAGRGRAAHRVDDGDGDGGVAGARDAERARRQARLGRRGVEGAQRDRARGRVVVRDRV